jgi:hypothetical protein
MITIPQKVQSERCRHRHTYLEHRACYFLERRENERLGFIDIEASNLSGDWGFLFGYCILDEKGKVYEDWVTKEDIKKWGRAGKEDKRVLQSLVNHMENFDRLIGHYSSRYDLPMIRTRAVMTDVWFPTYGAYVQTDGWRILRSKFKLRSNGLENSTRNLVGETRKDHFTQALMNGCVRGEKWAIDWAKKHCLQDVLDTRDLWYKINPYIKLANTSL